MRVPDEPVTGDLAEVHDLLRSARRAHAAASVALAAAERAATVAGVAVDPLELTVGRIRVVDPDGTLRLVIGNGSVGDILSLRGDERPHPGRRGAGLVFLNDDGTECGGLVASGDRDRQVVRLSFDSTEQNDAVVLSHVDTPGGRSSGLELTDQPRWSLVDLRDDLEAVRSEGGDEDAVRRRYAAQGEAHRRVRVGTTTDGDAVVALADAVGTERLRLVVTASGDARVDVRQGTIWESWPPESG